MSTALSIIVLIGVGFLVVTFLVLLALLSLFAGRRGRRDRHLDADEARVMQEIHQGLERMEKRVETLETLLCERERKDQS